MKKKLLIVLLATASVASVHAYRVKIDNDADGVQATTVSVQLFSNNEPALKKPYRLKADREKSFKFHSKKKTITNVKVIGLDGMGSGQSASFRIPQNKLNKNIKIDVDVKQRRLMLSQDK